jgi:ubiquinone/menaquinone biosynthesis C-methylase UbiE
MNQKTLRPDTKQAEKEYLRRSGGGEWELSKPFPPCGQTATEEHSQHLLDFAVLLRVLAPKPTDLILDLGAGTCWVSDWLRRSGFRTVAVDIALDMLRLGIERLGSAEALAVGDMERLPFRNASFERACCVNAFHHVPDTSSALREIRRVLKPNGVVFFSEPGRGHSSHPISISASRNYGVLENEILIDQFMEACLTAGFSDVLLHPMSHVVPLFVLERKQWQQWVQYSASRRPFRALAKIYRAALELVGLGKTDVLFEEAFAIRLVRELQPVIEQHPVITAHCAPFIRPMPVLEKAVLRLIEAPARADMSSTVSFVVLITNAGTTIWNEIPGDVRVGVQLLDSDGSVLNKDYRRWELGGPVRPGDQREVSLPIEVPSSTGMYALKFDLVREGIHWFENAGSEPRVHRLEIVAR